MHRTIMWIVVVLALGMGVAFSQVPQIMTYQGLLTDDTGEPVADGNYDLTFRIYDSSTGGTELWTENQPSVSVSGGLFKVFLGSVNPLTLAFDIPYWLEAQVGSGAPQSPRITLTTSPYCFIAADADQVDGFDAASTPMANSLLSLDATGVFPASAIPATPPGGAAGGDLTGTYPNPTIANHAVNSVKIQNGQVMTVDIADNAVTVEKIVPDVVTSIDGVSNDGGDIDLIGGSNITITPDDANNRITIDAAGGGGGDITAVWPSDGTLSGGGDFGDVYLAVANPLALWGTSNDGVIQAYNTNADAAGRLGNYARGLQADRISGSGPWGYVSGYVYGAYGANYEFGNDGRIGTPDYGVWGTNTSGTGGYLGTAGEGVVGASSGGNFYGLLGSNDHGAYGYNANDDSWGSLGNEQYGAGLWAEGYSGATYGTCGSYRGVEGLHFGTYNWGYIGSSSYAGFFSGDVNVTGNLSKGTGSFLIDHPLDPENKLLRHNFVESPENLLIYRGTVELGAGGEAVVEMPDYFKALTKEQEATVNLTPIGRSTTPTRYEFSYEWEGGYERFGIYGQPGRDVAWMVMAERDDPVMQQLARPVEEEKGPGNKYCDQGELLYPAAYGYPESRRPASAQPTAATKHEHVIPAEHRKMTDYKALQRENASSLQKEPTSKR